MARGRGGCNRDPAKANMNCACGDGNFVMWGAEVHDSAPLSVYIRNNWKSKRICVKACEEEANYIRAMGIRSQAKAECQDIGRAIDAMLVEEYVGLASNPYSKPNEGRYICMCHWEYSYGDQRPKNRGYHTCVNCCFYFGKDINELKWARRQMWETMLRHRQDDFFKKHVNKKTGFDTKEDIVVELNIYPLTRDVL